MTSSWVLVLYTLMVGFFLFCLLNLRTLFTRYPRPLPPGPKPWPVMGNLPHLGTMPHHAITDMARRYGPLMHLWMGSVHVVVAASASVAAQFLKTHNANFSSRPPSSGAKHIAYNYQNLAFAPYGPRWRMLRKICSVHLFSPKALDDFRHVHQEEVGILTRALASPGESTTVNLRQHLSLCLMNSIGRLLLGRRLFSNSNPKANELKSMVVEQLALTGVFNIVDFLPWLEWLDLQGMVKKMKELHVRFDSFLSEILEEHKLSSGGGAQSHTNFVSTLISLKDADGEGGKLTDTEIKALIMDMFIGGFDTSSITVEWAITELIRHPEVLAKAQQELDSIIGPSRLVTESDLPQLTYIQAIIKETFRLHPAAPLSLPRMAIESCEINGYFIPKGSTLLVNVWAIGRDPDAWANPLEFKPERFLPGGEKPNADVRGNNFEVIPFGAGRRICVGMSLGLLMVQLLTATLVQSFNWELPEGKSAEELNMDEAYGVTLQRAEPLMVYPRPRLATHLYRA